MILQNFVQETKQVEDGSKHIKKELGWYLSCPKISFKSTKQASMADERIFFELLIEEEYNQIPRSLEVHNMNLKVEVT